ncbi:MULTISPECIES: hypothetical protein [Acetobacter]|nr:hypothetical protein [Acetobacter sp. DsW_063]
MLSKTSIRTVRPGAVAALMLGLATLAACASPQEIVSSKEDHLSAAGFVDQPANTPERQAMLRSLPSHRFVRRTKGDSVFYVYADPTVCACLYVGSQDAYGRYRQFQQQQNLADEQAMSAQEYDNASWNWGAWGPGFGPGFMYGPGFGW